ncbi:hypothetical protein PVAND_007200 [Polypedilum vanderplanki]|uniref:Uncharacterized protein n=1 Tax=Polypedilum vanderplanki TaxID=319348 RepID=A0A9J6C5Y8_POLVA|nr:hypothetical protein PVAND_007200 [Polypedilum vanderplanki]
MLNLFESFSDSEIDTYKNDNFNLLNEFYKISCNFGDFHGENNTEYGQITIINEISFLIPPKCKFFNKNVIEIKKFLPESEKFDFIVIDPPWKCRYIKRLKKTFDQKSYNMMTNDEISNISLRNYTHKSSIVIIWATNSETHENFIKNSLLEKWDLKQIGIWHWIKVDKTGDTFCSFEGNKKPYEKIFIATHFKNDVKDIIEKEISIVSQSSSIHSHKPQLLSK